MPKRSLSQHYDNVNIQGKHSTRKQKNGLGMHSILTLPKQKRKYCFELCSTNIRYLVFSLPFHFICFQYVIFILLIHHKEETETGLTVKYMHLHVISRSCSYASLFPSCGSRTCCTHHKMVNKDQGAYNLWRTSECISEGPCQQSGGMSLAVVQESQLRFAPTALEQAPLQLSGSRNTVK